MMALTCLLYVGISQLGCAYSEIEEAMYIHSYNLKYGIGGCVANSSQLACGVYYNV
jgi:repressor of nif and glnA expression